MSPRYGEIDSSALERFPRLRRLSCFVRTHYTGDITLQQAADVACLDKKYFSRYFRRKVGVTFTFWLAHYRIEKAKDLLKNTNESVCMIAFAVGFGSLRSFERAFKTQAHVSAGAFRRLARGSDRANSPRQNDEI